mmetsp:Transcript_4819/g.14342  ORF Transcript_4819/g.14342 Transcript_4819/m.14342 type:complete len:422 (-) Transcript_4819:181-1446(-)
MAQFWPDSNMTSKAFRSGSVSLQLARGPIRSFMACPTVMSEVSRTAAPSAPPAAPAACAATASIMPLARSSADSRRTWGRLASAAASSEPTPPPVRTSRWWHAKPEPSAPSSTCAVISEAASARVVSGESVRGVTMKPGRRARPPRNHVSILQSHGVPSTKAASRSFSVRTPRTPPWALTTTAAERPEETRTSAALLSVSDERHVAVSRCATMSATVTGCGLITRRFLDSLRRRFELGEGASCSTTGFGRECSDSFLAKCAGDTMPTKFLVPGSTTRRVRGAPRAAASPSAAAAIMADAASWRGASAEIAWPASPALLGLADSTSQASMSRATCSWKAHIASAAVASPRTPPPSDTNAARAGEESSVPRSRCMVTPGATAGASSRGSMTSATVAAASRSMLAIPECRPGSAMAFVTSNVDK